MAKQSIPPGLRDEARRTVSNKKIKDEACFSKYSFETNGEYTEAIVLLNPSGSNPLHYHTTFTESFTTLSGKLAVQYKSEILHLEPATDAAQTTTFDVTPYTPHRFFNPSSTEYVRFRVRITPGSEDFERGIYLVYGLANDGLTDEQGAPKNFLHLCIMARLGDISVSTGYWVGDVLMAAVFKVGYWVARGLGMEKSLLERYWYD